MTFYFAHGAPLSHEKNPRKIVAPRKRVRKQNPRGFRSRIQVPNLVSDCGICGFYNFTNQQFAQTEPQLLSLRQIQVIRSFAPSFLHSFIYSYPTVSTMSLRGKYLAAAAAAAIPLRSWCCHPRIHGQAIADWCFHPAPWDGDPASF